MATTTRVLDANVNGTVYTSNANSALEALDTCHSGATAPTDEVANGKLWLDTSTTPGILKIYNNATWEVVHSGTVDINAGAIDGTTIGATTPAAVTTSSLVATTADINGGTIDGTVIGGTTPAAGSFTALTSNGIDDNAAATAVTIDASGNVGIGEASPSATLHVNVGTNTDNVSAVLIEGTNVGGTTTPDLTLYHNSPSPADGDYVGALWFYGNNSAAEQTAYAGIFGLSEDVTDASEDGAIAFVTTSAGSVASEAMRIDSSGNLLVGKTATATLGTDTTAGTTLYGAGIARHVAGSSEALQLTRTGTLGAVAAFTRSGTTVGSISITASSTSYNTSSDYRLKENIAPVQGAADIVKAMQPVTYTFKSDGSWHDGFLAHELQELHPRAVTGSKDAMMDEEYEVTPAVLDDDGNVVTEAVMGTRSVPDYQGVDYSKLTPILTAALQEALNKIEVLEARVAALEP